MKARKDVDAMSLLEIQSVIVARISTHAVGSAARFRLMDAADALSKAIAAEANDTPRQTGAAA